MESKKKQLKGFLRLKQVLELYPISRTAWLDGVRTGIYPKPSKLSERCVAWRVVDIEVLIASKK